MTASSAIVASPGLIKRDDDSGVVTLTLSTPQNRNALSLAMIETLIAAFNSIAGDEKVRVVVLAGEGPALSSGHNLKEMQAHRNDIDRGREFYAELFAGARFSCRRSSPCRSRSLRRSRALRPRPAVSLSPRATSPSLARTRALRFPASRTGSSVLRRWLRSAGRCRASMRWRWR